MIVGLREPFAIEEFTHVVALRKGKVAFQGAPSEWKAWKKRPEKRTA